MTEKGNFVAEWFGHRVFPHVHRSHEALNDQGEHCCPFLSAAKLETTDCIKANASLGVCTISSESNGPRQDWLVCPYRVLESPLLFDVIDHLFGVQPSRHRIVLAAPTLGEKEHRKKVRDVARQGGSAIIYLQDKLGGEISISRTDRSPELSFDCTLVELREVDGQIEITRYGIFEVQTMDFHGSYRHAVKNLLDARRLHGSNFHQTLEKNQQWLGEKIEGPNISNVFKRTFYQAMLKFQIGSHDDCTGSVLALPVSVWDSWQRHLGAPELTLREDGDFDLQPPGRTSRKRPPAWIYVFDLDSSSKVSPNPVVVRKRIATDADAVAHYALKVAPEAAIGKGGSARKIPERIRHRLGKWWPDLWQAAS